MLVIGLSREDGDLGDADAAAGHGMWVRVKNAVHELWWCVRSFDPSAALAAAFLLIRTLVSPFVSLFVLSLSRAAPFTSFHCNANRDALLLACRIQASSRKRPKRHAAKPRPQRAPALPRSSGVPAPADGDVLVEGGWPQVAAFVRESADSGRPSVVNLFASWCEPCEEELPLLLATSEADDGVRWIGVATSDVRRNAAPFVQQQAVTWPTVLDLDATTYDALLGRVMPTTAFFDAEGRLVDVVDGIVDEGRLATALDRAGS